MQKKSLIVLMIRYKMARHIINKWNHKLQGPVIETSSLKSTKLSAANTGHFIQSHKGLSPCDFDLIPKMKERLRGIRFRTVPEILQAVDGYIRTINTTGAAKGILRLPHRWQRVVHNAGDYIEGQ